MQPTHLTRRPLLTAVPGALAVTGLASSGRAAFGQAATADVTSLNVSYDPTQELGLCG